MLVCREAVSVVVEDWILLSNRLKTWLFGSESECIVFTSDIIRKSEVLNIGW